MTSRWAFAALVALLCCAADSAARAEEQSTDRLARVRLLIENAEYRRVCQAVPPLLGEGGLLPAQLAETYRALAECSAALRRRTEARDAFVRLLAIDPGYALAATASPLLRAPYQSAEAFWRDKQRPAIRFTPVKRHDRGEPLLIEAEIEAGELPELAADLTIHLRQPDESWEVLEMPAGRFELAPADLEGLERLVFFLALRDDRGNYVQAAGTPEAPFEVELFSPEELTPPPAPDEPEAPPLVARRPWFRRWWVWTILGSVAAGLTVGLAVGLTSGEGDLCEGALGEPCDYRATFRP